MKCTVCGNDLRDGAKFCAKCGTKQAQPFLQNNPEKTSTADVQTIQKQGGTKFEAAETCPNCGKTVVPGSVTCWECNAILRELPPQKETVPHLAALVSLPPDALSSARKSLSIPVGIIAAILVIAMSG